MAATYFDFHFHPVFKKYLSRYEEHYPSQRLPEELMQEIQLSSAFMDRLDHDVLHFLGSQSCLNQASSGGLLLGVANIATLEYAIAATDTLLGNVLKSSLTDPLDKAYFDLVTHGGTSYYHLFIKELNLYSILANTGSMHRDDGTAHISILNRQNKDVQPFDSYKGVTLALSMEGGHNLNRNIIDQAEGNMYLPAAGDHDAIYRDCAGDPHTPVGPAESLQRLYRAMLEEGLDLMYLTLTHLTNIWEQPLATHAYGMKMLNHHYFYPAGNGLTDTGKAVIAAAYGMTTDGLPAPLLIDVKHMSLKSRLDLYEYRKQNNINLPILATHVGISGYSVAEWISSVEDVKMIPTGTPKNPQAMRITAPLKIAGMENSGDEFTHVKYYFNPWNINLMDEDIEEILRSGGLIGLSLDARITGGLSMIKNREYDTTEYLSAEEYRYLKDTYGTDKTFDVMTDIDPDTDVKIYTDDDLKDEEKDPYREIVSVVFNLLHVLAVAMRAGIADPWSQVVIGSDYDGLIDPVLLSLNCTHLAKVEECMNDLIVSAERSYLHFHPVGEGMLVPRNANGHTDRDALARKIRGVMYENGRSFMKRWYEGTL